jgi:hypothetical protein
VRRQRGDLVTQALQRRNVVGGGKHFQLPHLHGASPSRFPDSSPGFRSHRGASRRDVFGAALDFFDREGQVVLGGGAGGPLERRLASNEDKRLPPAGKSSSEKCWSSPFRLVPSLPETADEVR